MFTWRLVSFLGDKARCEGGCPECRCWNEWDLCSPSQGDISQAPLFGFHPGLNAWSPLLQHLENPIFSSDFPQNAYCSPRCDLNL